MEQSYKVAEVSEIPEAGGKAFEVAGKRVAIFRLDDGFVAIDDCCSHGQASLAEGRVENGQVECPRHGARFDLRTGAALSLPAIRPVATYELEVKGDSIFIKL